LADAIVLDSSAILAGLYGEPGAAAVIEVLASDEFEVLVSAVNLCEVVTKLVQAGASASQISASTDQLHAHCVEFDSLQAVAAGEMVTKTQSLGLSLGDRACLSLAASRGANAWTTDSAWKKLNLGVKVRLLRGE
jgi:ribonuclease VapC